MMQWSKIRIGCEIKILLLSLFLIICTAPNFQELAHLMVHQKAISHTHIHNHDGQTHIHHHSHQDGTHNESDPSHAHQFSSLLKDSPVIMSVSVLLAWLPSYSLLLTNYFDNLNLDSSYYSRRINHQISPINLLDQYLVAYPIQGPPLS